MVDVLSGDELFELLERSGKEGTDRGRYYGTPGLALARLVKRGWVISEIRDLYVIPEERGKGYGKGLLQYLVQTSQTPVVFLTVREDNDTMRGLCKKVGFKEITKIRSPQGNSTVFSVYIREG